MLQHQLSLSLDPRNRFVAKNNIEKFMIFSPQYIEDIHTPEIEQLTKRTKVDHLQTVCRELCLGFDLSHKTVWPLKTF